MDILDDMGVSKLSAKVFFKVNYSFKFLRENIQGVYIEKKITFNNFSCFTFMYVLSVNMYDSLCLRTLSAGL